MIEAEDQAHGGGLACAVRPQEASHAAWFDGEGQVINGHLVPKALSQVSDFDHRLPRNSSSIASLRYQKSRNCFRSMFALEAGRFLRRRLAGTHAYSRVPYAATSYGQQRDAPAAERSRHACT